MNVTAQDLAPCKKLLRIEVDAAVVDQTFESITGEYQRQARLPGFRAGKAPRHLVLRTFAKDIESEVRRKLVGEHYRKGVEELKLHPVTMPDIEEVQFGRGQALHFTATVETAPEFELPAYEGLEVKRESAMVTDADVERALARLQEQRAQYENVARPIETGDYAVVNYRGTCEGKPLTDIAPTARGLTEKQNFWLHIQPGSFIPGFTEPLVGAVAGEKRTVEVDFPADFVAAALGGKKGVYEVEVVEVKVKKLPPVDDAFAQELGAQDTTQLREGVRRDLQNDLAYRVKKSVRDQLVRHLLERVQCELPEAVVLSETRSAVYDIVRENTQRGVPKEVLDQQKDQIFSVANNSAKDRVKTAFILARIAAKEGIKVEDKEVTQRILFLAQQYGVRPEQMVKQLRERNGIQEIQEQIMQAKVLDLLELKAKVEDVLPSNAQA